MLLCLWTFYIVPITSVFALCSLSILHHSANIYSTLLISRLLYVLNKAEVWLRLAQSWSRVTMSQMVFQNYFCSWLLVPFLCLMKLTYIHTFQADVCFALSLVVTILTTTNSQLLNHLFLPFLINLYLKNCLFFIFFIFIECFIKCFTESLSLFTLLESKGNERCKARRSAIKHPQNKDFLLFVLFCPWIETERKIWVTICSDIHRPTLKAKSDKV